MKVEQNKEFQPITITLETEFEARVLQTLVGNVAGHNEFRTAVSELCEELTYLGVEAFGGDFYPLESNKVYLES